MIIKKPSKLKGPSQRGKTPPLRTIAATNGGVIHKAPTAMDRIKIKGR